MASCSQWFYAKDQDGNYPSAVDPEFTLRNFLTGAIIGTYTIPSYGLQLTLDSSIKYKAIPHLFVSDEANWVRPSDVEFYGCAKDVTFVWKKKICTTGAKKCVGDDVYVCSSDGTEWRYSKNCPGGCSAGECIEVPIGNGFTINVATGLSGKTLLVAHVVKMPFIGLVGPDPDLWYWPQAFDYVGGKWYTADPATKYRVEVGSIFETIPSFDKTYGTGSFADGIHCVVLAEGEGGVGSLIFKGEDVFQLFKDSPTEIYLSSTSNDVISEAVMGPVCDLFGIPRGPQCTALWTELYDPVFVANYFSILKTKKDTLGNSRELTWFDHIALPFALIGVLAPQLPFGRFVSEGLQGLWKGGKIFSDAAFNWMETVAINTPVDKIVSEGPWTFMQSIIRISGDHLDEVMELIHKDDFATASSKLEEYLASDLGNMPYRVYTDFNDALRKYLPLEQWEALMDTIYGFGPQADSILKTASKTSPTADDLADIAKAAGDPNVMDEVGDAVYNSIKTGDNVDDVNNILKNLDGSPGELAYRLYAAVASGASEVDAIAKNIVELDGKNFKAVMDSWTSSQKVGLFNTLYSGSSAEKALYNAMKSIDNHHSVVESSLGTTKASGWVENVLKTSRAAHKTADPGKMSDIPHAVQDLAAKQGELIEDYCGGHIEPCYSSTSDTLLGAGKTAADDIVEQTEGFYFDSHSLWAARAKQYVDLKYSNAMRWFDDLSEVNKERAVHGMVASTMFFAVVLLYKIYTDAGPQSLNHALFTSSMDRWYWPCFYACESKDANTLDEAIKLYESEINDCEKSLYDYKAVLESDGTYDKFYKTLKLHQFQLSRMKICLENLQPCGNIHCTSNTNFFYVDLDGQPAGFSFGNYEVLLKAVKVGSHTVKIHKHNWTPECTESVNVTEGVPKEVDCQMTETGVCSPVTAVSIYIDPLSPIKDQTVSFNGSAKSDDPITKWEWDFGDGFTATGQAVTHSYKYADVYKVELTVTNDCGKYTTAMRNVTVSEEAPPVESTTLTIERMIYESGVDIPRYWEVEIWVDGKYTECQGPQTLIFGTGVYCDCAAPWNLVPCELGQHTITLKKYGYDDVSISVYLEKDKPKTWESPVMVKSVAPPTQRTISFSVPVGSTVYVGGKPLTGTTVVGRLSMILNSMRK